MPTEEINRRKDQIIEIGIKAREARLIASKDGNLSIRIANPNPSPEDLLLYRLLVTPSGVYKEDLKRDQIVLIGPQCEPSEPTHTPTSDLAIHIAMYAATDLEAAGILHVHGDYANLLALQNIAKGFDHPLGNDLLGRNYRISDDARLGRVAITDNPMGEEYQKRVIDYATQFIPGCDVLLVPTQGSYILSRDNNHPLRDCLDKALHLERLAKDVIAGLLPSDFDGTKSFERDLKKCEGLTVGEMPGYDQARNMEAR